jgi:hypothetical protein
MISQSTDSWGATSLFQERLTVVCAAGIKPATTRAWGFLTESAKEMPARAFSDAGMRVR